ncbi:MAG: DEAD/DEAH box helicase, partial [Erysipelotrichia bacterium]|nr:DEAD/DEAH box helicase [Erysipelotrichia bacterium]
FCRQKVIKSSYAVSNGRYCVFTPELKKALGVVRSISDKPESLRRAFLANPRVFLREQLETEISEMILENLFRETEEYSDRVLEIGVWVPPVLPILKRAGEPWLPPEILGIRVGNRDIKISPAKLPGLIKEVKEAIESSLPSVKFENEIIPATDKTLEILIALNSEAQKFDSQQSKNNQEQDQHKIEQLIEPKKDPIGLLIDRHLEQVGKPLKRRIPIDGVVNRSLTGMASSLMQHQQTGVEWLQEHWLSGSRGALLADDMGLGKTFQVLAFLFWVRQLIDNCMYEKLPFLLVAPTGLLKNWQDEISQHLGQFGLGNILLAYGANLKNVRNSGMTGKSESDTGIPSLNIDAVRGYDGVLTTYETLRDYQLSFGAIHWGVAVFDEAQKVKNPAVRITDAAKAMHSDFSITMTGTPVENRLADLWSICDLCQPGSLFSLKQFSETYEQAATEDNLRALKTVLTERTDPALMLRRLKEDNLKGLPQREFLVLKRDMPSEQSKAYEEVIRKANKAESAPGRMLEALHGLRSVSLHPCNLTLQNDEEYIKQSARLIILFELLEKIESKSEKALVFVESLEMHGILAELLQRRFKMSAPPLIISGEVSGDNRKKRVDNFQMRRGFDVMLLSPRAGGVGLTLHAANHVIHLSRWWNPAVEDQCTDRVYRIGQNKNVNVYLPLAVHPQYQEDSFDIRLNALLERKRTLSRTLLASPASSHQDVASLYREVIP